MYKLTIITSTFNAANHINNLFKSIRKYKKDWVQWIIVDGESTDGTIELLKKNRDLIDTLIIEKDFGIYDAWNKALKHVKSDYICFIGSDDDLSETYFFNVEKSIELNVNNYNNVICFKIATFEQNKDNIVFELHTSGYNKPKNYPFNLGFHHQGTLFFKDLFIDNIFDSSYKILGDLAQLTLVNEKLNPKVFETLNPQYYFNNAGISSIPKKIILRYQERIKIIKSINNKLIYKLYLISIYNLKIIYTYILKKFK